MHRKKDTQILFTNDTYLEECQTKRGNRQRNPSNKEYKAKPRTFDFAYCFRDYLKLMLAKVIPRHHGIVFIPEREIIIGDQKLCTQMIEKGLNELKTYKFKVAYANNEGELDQLDYWLEEGATIYRPGVIEVALKLLEKYDIFKNDIEGMRTLLEKHMFLIRVERDKVAMVN
jgi:hypothetical protein